MPAGAACLENVASTRNMRRTIHEIQIAYLDARIRCHDSWTVLSGSLCPVEQFGFLTNHGLALLCIAQDPEIRMRDIAAEVDITERATQRIVGDLVEAGYLGRERVGRRNRYTIQTSLPISLPAQRDLDLNALLNVLVSDSSNVERRDAMPSARGAS
jgi:DNA-binding MarR family transcriptional regulator